jgi:hypothetical protein
MIARADVDAFGILDASRPWLEALPAPARTAVLDGDREWFDRELRLATLFAPEITARPPASLTGSTATCDERAYTRSR